MTAEDNIVRLAEVMQRMLPAPTRPMEVARVFAEQCTHDRVSTLRSWRGGWWEWRTSHWHEIEAAALRNQLYRFTEHALYQSGDAFADWAPTRHKIANLLEAVAAVCFLSDEHD